ncbi:MAG TPA: M67 family metallopeptidase [Fodinibius sp.]|nr:M67 family metallopeptidase [Fodinibius sp.]
MRLEISRQALLSMQHHAEHIYPNECCGFFYGVEGDVRRVEIIQRVQNAREGDQRRRFQIDPRDYQKAEKFALDHELDLLGVYHSHPDHPAVPSGHDLKVAMPWFSYIIVSVQDGDTARVRSWRLTDNREFEEEEIAVNELENENSTTEKPT